MNILSLFDGMSCGQLAINKLNIPINNYHASEIEEESIQVTQSNFPNTIQVGNVCDLDVSNLEKIDLLIGGSPCQSFSFNGKRKGMVTKDNIEITNFEQYLELKKQGFEFDGQSYLFWEYVRVLRESNAKYFLLENVLMSKKWEDIVTKELGVEPIKINSDCVSAQNRKRLYWTNVPFDGIIPNNDLTIKDILENKSVEYFETYKASDKRKILLKNNSFNSERVNDINSKCQTLMAGHGMGGSKPWIFCPVLKDIRSLTEIEFERLQTVPDNYTNKGISRNKSFI